VCRGVEPVVLFAGNWCGSEVPVPFRAAISRSGILTPFVVAGVSSSVWSVSPLTVVVVAIDSTTTSWVAGGRPRRFMAMTTARCLILFSYGYARREVTGVDGELGFACQGGEFATGVHPLRPQGVAVADVRNNRGLRLAAGSNSQTVLPFTGLTQPEGVAVDTADNLYVTDWGNNRVVKLPVG
jgi:NHL repeat